MPEDLYPSVDEPVGKNTPESSEQPDETEEGVTALLPKSILGGKEFEVGDSVVLKIVRLHGDEVEVEYDRGEEEETPEAEIDGISKNRPPRGMMARGGMNRNAGMMSE